MKRRHHSLFSARALLSTCLVFVSTSLLSTSAMAQTLDDGLEAYLDADFRRASSLLEDVLRSGSLSRSERATALIHYAALQMIFDDRDRALELTEIAVGLDPDVQQPEGVDVAITQTLDNARSASEERPLRLHIEAEAPLASGQQAEIVARLQPEPENFDVRLVLSCRPLEQPRVQERSEGPVVALTYQVDEGPLECRALARTHDGFIILRAREAFGVERRRSRRALALGLGLGLGATALTTLVVVLVIVLTGRQIPIDGILVEGW